MACGGLSLAQDDAAPAQAQEPLAAVEAYLDTFALRDALEKGEPVVEVANRLMEEGHAPQRVAHEILLLQPDAANDVAVAMALHSPQEAPFVAAAISWMASSQPAPIAAAVATAVPEMAPEVASHVAAAFPQQTTAVARAVAQALPEQLTTIARTMGSSVPEEAAAVIRGTAPLVETPLAVVDFLVEVFAALPIPLAAFVEPQAGLVILNEGDAERIIPTTEMVAEADGEADVAENSQALDAAVAVPLGISVGDGLAPGEQINTGAEAKLMMVLRDGSVLSVFGQTRLTMGGEPRSASANVPVATLEQGLIRVVGGEGKPRSWKFALGAGSLTVAGADVLLARGEQGVGIILLNGTAVWANGSGVTRTLSRGRYQGDLLGGLGRSAAGANIYDWLAALGLETLEPGDLAEQSVWMAGRLGRTIALGGSSDIQTP